MNNSMSREYRERKSTCATTQRQLKNIESIFAVIQRIDALGEHDIPFIGCTGGSCVLSGLISGGLRHPKAQSERLEGLAVR